ncbi:MAG: hypothetical protein ACLR4A_10045 [Christensenellales bacterium]
MVEGGRQPCYNRLMIEYCQKVADLWPRYGEIDSTIVHQAIVVSLINLEMTCVCLGTYPPEKGYQRWQAMKQIQASPRLNVCGKRKKASPTCWISMSPAMRQTRLPSL